MTTTNTLRIEGRPTNKRALVVVDVQNDFISGSLAVKDGEEVAEKVAELVRSGGYDVVAGTQDWHIDPGDHWSEDPDYVDSWPVHCQAGSKGADLHPAFDKVTFDITVRKGHHSAAYSGFEGIDAVGQSLDYRLHQMGVTQVDVVGIATDYCVKATALDAQSLGYETQVLLPYTAAVSPEGLATAIDDLKEAGVQVL